MEVEDPWVKARQRACSTARAPTHSAGPQHCSLFQTAIVKNKLLEMPAESNWFVNDFVLPHLSLRHLAVARCTYPPVCTSEGVKLRFHYFIQQKRRIFQFPVCHRHAGMLSKPQNYQQMWTLFTSCEIVRPIFWLLARRFKYFNSQMSNAHLTASSEGWYQWYQKRKYSLCTIICTFKQFYIPLNNVPFLNLWLLDIKIVIENCMSLQNKVE